MSLSHGCLAALLDLVEIKLSSMQIFDREDAREALVLEECRGRIAAQLGVKSEPVFAALLKGKRARVPSRTAH